MYQEEEGWDTFNRFNAATFVTPSQDWIFNVIYVQ